MRLKISGKSGRLYTSNDQNALQRTPNLNPLNLKNYESYKKSFADCFSKDNFNKKKDIILHKINGYTRSYDSNQFNFNFKKRRKMNFLAKQSVPAKDNQFFKKPTDSLHEGGNTQYH